MYIIASSMISHQQSFNNDGFSQNMSAINKDSMVIHPNYNAFFSPIKKRRMSEVMQMSVACSLNCLEKAKMDSVDAIIVGTGMGCGIHTKNFIKSIAESDGGLISPTSFILSTHNTIAGQLSIILESNSYNITHTQNSLSFEYSIIDAKLNLVNSKKGVLVGGAEEAEIAIHNLQERLKNDAIHITSGASFFILSNEKSSELKGEISNIAVHGLVNEIQTPIVDFLKEAAINTNEIDLILYTSSNDSTKMVLDKLFRETRMINIQDYSGSYITNSGFALSFAFDEINFGTKENAKKRILICNNLISENLGLMIIEG